MLPNARKRRSHLNGHALPNVRPPILYAPGAPLRGFKVLHPRICIHLVPINSDADRLPSAATCMNLLKLPQYSSAEVLAEKLLYSITSGSGFELS